MNQVNKIPAHWAPRQILGMHPDAEFFWGVPPLKPPFCTGPCPVNSEDCCLSCRLFDGNEIPFKLLIAVAPDSAELNVGNPCRFGPWTTRTWSLSFLTLKISPATIKVA